MNALADRAKAIFLEATEKPSLAEQTAFVQNACGNDAELRRRVETLLHAHQQEDSFLDPGKLHQRHTPSGHTQTSDFAETSGDQSGNAAGNRLHELAAYFTPSQQPHSLGRFLHFEVLELLGQGGCGIVYRVFDTKLHRMVALKIMSPTLASHPASRLRFLREARAAAAVRHEHVISIHSVDETPLPHLIMEYISGQSLQQKIDKAGSLSTKEILRIGYQVALGLEAAHKQGLIHRDIKPANILLENGIERVKITDFGLARTIDDTSISNQGLIVGTPSYMSPEQAEGQPVDTRSDLFSLGSTMYAMCTGQSPFQGSSTLSVLKGVVEGSPRPLREANPEMPEWMEAVILRLLAKKPEERYQNASVVADELGSYLAELQSKGIVQPPKPSKSRFQRIIAVSALVGLILFLLAFAEKRGFTNFTTPVLKLFYHELTLHLPDRDTIVEVWQTSDTSEKATSMTLTSSWPFVPTAIVVSETERKLKLPPGRYWLLARRHGKRIDRRLLSINWGGISSITLTVPTSSTNESGTSQAQPRLLKAFDPKVEKPVPAPWADPAKTVFVEEDTWRVENPLEAGMFYFAFSPLQENLPTDGIIICRAKIKTKKKSNKGWGELLLNAEQPDLAGFDWPKQQYHFESELEQWTSKEIRYPAKIFFDKNPPQISVFFSFHMTGTIWIKDLELLHQPGPVPASTSRVPELVKLVELSDQQLKKVNEEYQAGKVSYDVWLKAKIQWLNHCITLAEERKLHEETIKLLVQLKDTHDKQLQFARQLIHAGRIKESDAIPIQAEIVKTELRLKQAKAKK